jgi:hypothetical protein
MKFEEALKEMKFGKKIKLPERDFYLSLINKVYYDGNDDRPAEIIPISDILREDWEVLD